MKSFGRVVVAASAAVAFTAGSAFVAPVVGADPLGSLGSGSLGSVGDNCGEQVVTSVNEPGDAWATPDDETPAKIGEAPKGAPESVGTSALTFPADTADKKGTSLYKNANEMKLSELSGEGDNALNFNFDYSTDGQAPALQIRLNEASLADSEASAAGFADGFATIVWSPKNADGWAKANPAESNEFWVTRALKDGESTIARGTRMTLTRIIELNKNAVVTEYGVQKTNDNKANNVAIDNFQFGCEVTNFELPADPGPLGSLSGIFGSLTGSL